MKTLTAAEIREAFLRFFEERAHRRVASSSLVPQNDPTLLFTNAGMVQFKDVFTGREKRDYTRATTAQKCVRAGGKHNDLENVGLHRPPPHLLRDARELLLRRLLQEGRGGLGLGVRDQPAVAGPRRRTRLAATVFDGEGGLPWDEEAFELWKAQGVPAERIYKLGAKDNFWAMGDTGPCGPCSEIHFFQGNDIPCAEEKAGREVPRASPATATAGSRSGTSSSCSSSGAPAATSRRCPSPPSTPAPASSAWPRWRRASARTTTPTSSRASSAPSRRSPARRTARPARRRRLDAGHRRPRAGHHLPGGRRRPALQRGARLRAPPHHAARHPAREAARPREALPRRRLRRR